MWHAAIRDLIWRRRRYSISVLGTALVFAVSLVVTGISDAFPAELDDTFDTLGAKGFILPDGVSGPFTGAQPFDPNELPAGTDPLAYLIQTANPEAPEMVAVFGLTPGKAEPSVVSGHQIDGAQEALVDDASAFDTGSSIDISGRDYTVVGRVDGLTVNAGMSGVVIPLETFQDHLMGGLPLVTAGITRTAAESAPSGFHAIDLDAAREDALRILGDATSTIEVIKILLWIVAALIVGSVMFLSAVERSRDFAVFKAIGADTRGIAGGIALQATILSVSAALIGEVLGFALAPLFALPVVLSTTTIVAMPLVALAIGLFSAVFALRRALSVDPALAFGGAA